MSLPPLVANQQPMSARVVDDLVRPLLVRLAEVADPCDGESGICTLCKTKLRILAIPEGQRSPWSGRMIPLVEYDHRGHRPECPWRQARELLGIPLLADQFLREGEEVEGV